VHGFGHSITPFFEIELLLKCNFTEKQFLVDVLFAASRFNCWYMLSRSKKIIFKIKKKNIAFSV